jgi:hypothetical protein
MKIIVLAHPKDDHAAPIQWALEQAGYQAACWSGVSWTEQEQASLLLLLDQPPGICLGAHKLESDDVVWLRQPDQPVHSGVGPEAGKKSATAFIPPFLMRLLTCWKTFLSGASTGFQHRAWCGTRRCNCSWREPPD